MRKKSDNGCRNNEDHSWVYMLHCSNGSYYTGYADDLVRRYGEHLQDNNRTKYTRSFPVKGIAACWRIGGSRGAALKIEGFIKSMKRVMKDRIVNDPPLLGKMVKEELGIACSVTPGDPKSIEREHKARFSGGYHGQ